MGYGDAFTLGLVPKVGSRPGSDVLQGIDALVEEGAADPERLTIGGYSFGGYLTNWLITQTTRFKAAVTGAGDAEFVVNWGNNKFPLPYAYSLLFPDHGLPENHWMGRSTPEGQRVQIEISPRRIPQGNRFSAGGCSRFVKNRADVELNRVLGDMRSIT